MNKDIYTERRRLLVATMASDSRLLLAGNSDLERTRDVAYPFRQSNNVLYLTGVAQPDVVLAINKQDDNQITEVLYVKKLHPFMEVWEGRSNKLDELRQTSGIAVIQEYQETTELLTDLPQIVYIDMPDEPSAQIAAWRFWDELKQAAPDVELAAINPAITELRVIKQPQEIAAIERAARITNELIEYIRPLLVPGVTERAIAAEFVRAAATQGYEQSWPPIVSFGKNTCTIHHTPDNTELRDGDLALLDVGIEVDGYSSDISRTFQIGAVSKRQQQVYEAVQQVQSEALKLMKPGIQFDDFERQAAQIMVDALVDLGLFSSAEEALRPEGELQWPAYRRYFSHMTSHFLGLDGHDVGPRDAVFAPGMVLTCEPGIYIAEEGIGVRIEDDVLIIAQGNRLLS